jgi:SET domain-containing protein
MLFNKHQLISQIRSGALVKLIPSSIVGAGVGVEAITEIDKGEVVFAPKDTHFVRWSELLSVESDVINYIKKICNNNEYGFWIDCYINDIGAAYFVNHSDEPNLIHDRERDIYYAAKKIEIGEELTCKYSLDEIDWV